jgi:serine/threonine protein kinase
MDRLIGKGGMGVVWAATNKRTGKRVALKAIRRSCAPDSEPADLFRREALAAGRVSHPNVVNVFDIIDHESMTCIVMELLDGEPLNEYMAREGPLNMERAAALLLPAMRGVAAAHAQGVVHRDIKPHNIFLCVGPDGRVVTAKVLDFGNSLLIGQPTDTSQVSTVGTPAYMAPEHIQGAPRIDARVDVYGFGVVFFEALTGRHPFAGPPGESILTRIVQEAPLSLAELRPDLPQVVVHIIEHALAKDPNRRHPDLNSFIRMVEDNLLPSSALPRNLTPLAGISIVPLVESTSGGSDTAVQITRRSEDSDLHETRSLYHLRGTNTSGAGRNRSRIRLNPSSGQNQASARPDQSTPAPVPDESPARTRKIAAGAIFGAILIFVVWAGSPMLGRKNAPQVPKPTAAPVPSSALRVASLPEAGTAGIPATVDRPQSPVTVRMGVDGSAQATTTDKFNRHPRVPAPEAGLLAPAVSTGELSAPVPARTSRGRADRTPKRNAAMAIPSEVSKAASAEPAEPDPAPESAAGQPVAPGRFEPPSDTKHPATRAGSLTNEDF